MFKYIIYINIFSRAKVCVVVGYGPNERNGEEKERFRNDLNRVVGRGGKILNFRNRGSPE